MTSDAVVTITKEYVQDLRKNGTNTLLDLMKSKTNVGELMLILKNLGHLPKNFDTSSLIPLLSNENENVRILVVKNLAKTESIDYLNTYIDIIAKDESTLVKREAVSAIGRIRSEKSIPALIQLLKNEDPKIVCQAIRGLLVFKGNEDVDNELKKLINHENEIVKDIIQKEFLEIKKKNSTQMKHPETYDFLKNVVINADVIEALKYVPDESVHLTFTSPPYYNARDYSIYPSYEAYLKFLENVFKETYRITKEGRFLIVNTSPVIVPRISRSHSSKRYPIPFDLHAYLVRMGWEFIDDIIWMKPEYSVKNRIGGFQQHRKPLAYKPNSVTEYLMVYRKKTDKLLDWNIHQYSDDIVQESKVKEDDFETSNVWQICPKSDKVHPAVFPSELCRRVIEYYSYKNDLVFDPFGGSGTMGYTAKKLGRYFLLTEKDKKYFDYMKSYPRELSDSEIQNTKFFTLEEFKETIKDDPARASN